MLFTIGNDFIRNPAGRYYTDGDGSGEEFREEFLRPMLEYVKNRDEKLSINIDTNVSSYGSSFLVEAFGHLVTYGYYDESFLVSKIEIKYERQIFSLFAGKIVKYISDATFNSKDYLSTKEEALENRIYKGEIDKTQLLKLIG
ncbi:STAS-like domain-containing protein [Aliivibrio salmonicida]|uniref:STAS-like domain-containing protein n=1 Tax=Aliivibrio salmonicida TaxID=40269 RepID=UPI00406C25D7